MSEVTEAQTTNYLPMLTNSRLSCQRRCARRHFFRYERGYRRRVGKALPLLFGGLIHIALEAWWKAKQAMAADALSIALNAMADRVQVINADEVDSISPFEVVRAEEMIKGYDVRWGDEELEVLDVEIEFTIPLINSETGAASRTFALAGKFDAVCSRKKRLWIVEHKSSGSDIAPESDYWRKLKMDGQVSLYYQGAKALGHEVEGCLYDVLRKPGLRPKSATPEKDRYKKNGELKKNATDHNETPEEFRVRVNEEIASNPDKYYQRGDVFRLEDEMEEFALDVWQTARIIRENQLAGRWPRNPNGCELFNRLCEYFDVCTGAADIEDQMLFVRVDDVHPELETVHEPPTAKRGGTNGK